MPFSLKQCTHAHTHLQGVFAGEVDSSACALSFLSRSCCSEQGLPVWDYSTRWSSGAVWRSTQRLITWSGICQAILLGGVTRRKRAFAFYGLLCFPAGWCTVLCFAVALKSGLVCDTVPLIVGLIQAAEKTCKLLSVNGSRTDSGAVLFCLSVVTYAWSHHMTGFKKHRCSVVQRQHRKLSAFSHGFSFSHVSCLSTFRHGTHTQFLCWSLVKKQIHVLQGWSDDMLIFSPTPHHCPIFFLPQYKS